jgi:hypothetical protein
MRPLLRKYLKILIVVIFILQIAACAIVLNFRNAANCVFIRASNFRHIDDKVYVSEDTTPEEEQLLLTRITSARARVTLLWGSAEALPVIIYCHSDFYYKKFGSKYGGGASHWVTPFGGYIALGPGNLDINSISHELCHSELFKRVGFMANLLEIPAWFNEGLATFLSYEISGGIESKYYQKFTEHYTRSINLGKPEIKLEEITERDAFNRLTEKHGNIGYYKSGMETARWFQAVGREGLLELVERVRSGESFMDAYKSIEERTSVSSR